MPLELRKLCNLAHFVDAGLANLGAAIDTVCYHAGIEDMKGVLAEKDKAKQVALFKEVLAVAKAAKKGKKVCAWTCGRAR